MNTTQVMANWLIGREIVEEEQRGRRRAGYGTALLGELAGRLRTDFGAGYGVDNLELFRRFYREYPQLLAEAVPERISDAPRRKSGHAATALLVPPTITTAAWKPGRLNPGLSWTHYRRLLRVDREEARVFYETKRRATPGLRVSWIGRWRACCSTAWPRAATSKGCCGWPRAGMKSANRSTCSKTRWCWSF
ncbi:DUF1016 N-terminal domain-containing protein [Verminephrobacter aporrectodeae]|uniref:DUF1016 N-terminal domain-containing protein n=1 Tax=Verminephrobacter aporrectodeae TaxID=1110389 RepID=UPI002238C60C|nr:DUF1016 N-terminal domain-containing protein [Verminephrobacter aporrectodeae]